MRIGAITGLALFAVFASPLEADEEWGRNPFAFGRANATAAGNGTAHAKSSGPSLCVEMVMMHEGKSMAVINGRTVAVNDIVNGAVVTVISMDSVSFAKNGKTLVRRVGDDSDETR
ncbi:MAG: hypothetical protein HQK86_14440 [Nitrospinae bacterium]|nr:hypothetical protein [Nitrospinota bacterium]